VAALDWETTADDVDAAVAAATSDAQATIGAKIGRDLRKLGELYDACLAAEPSIVATKDAALLAHVGAISTWSTNAEDKHNEAHRAVRHAFARQAAERDDETEPYLLDGVVLHAASLVFGTDEGPPVTAALVLEGDFFATTIPALRVVAKLPGGFGNRVEVKVLDASDGDPTHFALRVKLDPFEELYDNVTPGELDVSASLLLASAEFFAGNPRPSNADYTPLEGGAGLSRANLEAEAARAKALPIATEDPDIATLIDRTLALARKAYDAKPEPKYPKPYGFVARAPSLTATTGEQGVARLLVREQVRSVRELEERLQAAKDLALEWLAEIA
jgi:hypothetical protein